MLPLLAVVAFLIARTSQISFLLSAAPRCPPALGSRSSFAGERPALADDFFVASGWAVVGVVTLLAVPRSKRRPMGSPRRYRKMKNTEGPKNTAGYWALTKDVGHAGKILGIASDLERPPEMKMKVRWWVANKMYKVIRRSSSMEMAPASEVAQQQFISPAVWNTPLFRAAAILLGASAFGGVLPFTALLHLTTFGAWLGANIWTTFFAGITMFKNMPRQQFGRLQAKLFPLYFQLGTGCTMAMALTASRLGISVVPSLVSLFATLANLLILEPTTTANMFERYDRENQGLKDEDRDKALKANFGKLHGLSSLANLVALVALIAHGTSLAARL